MFRKRRPRVVQSFNTAALRDAADHLSGWTYSGSGDLSRFKEPPTLLRNAANEIERLRAAAVLEQTP